MSERPAPSDDGPPAPRRRRRIPWWGVAVVIVAVLLAGEAFARFVGPSIEREAGSEERLLIKSDQIFDRQGDRTDVVVIGSSESAGGLAPDTIDEQVPGLNGVYNAALIGPTMDVTREWNERVVIPHLDPKVAVIGLLPMSVLDEDFVADQSGLEEQRRAVDAYRSAIDQVDPSDFHGLGWQVRERSALIRYRPYLRSPVLVAKATATAIRGGPDDVDVPTDPNFDWLKETDPARVKANTSDDGRIYDYRQPSLPITEDPIGANLYNVFGTGHTDFTQLQALVDDLRAQGVTPVIAIAPADRAPLEAGGADLAPLDDIVGEIRDWAEARDIPVNDQFTRPWDSQLFHDRNHLDEAGAQAWSTVVGDWLDDLCADGTIQGCAAG